MKIPKIIHWCWFSKEVSAETQNYVDGWKKLMPDYEFICWNADNFDIHSVKWVEQAVEHKKWAFAADYIRLWAVYNYGGIYLDSDVEVLKSFDNLLDMPYFLCVERFPGNLIEIATFGAQKECFWLKDCLDYYENRNFVKNENENEFDCLTLPTIVTHILRKKYGEKIKVLAYDYFSPMHARTREISITENTYSIHRFEGSWKQDRKSIPYPKIHISNSKPIYIWGTGVDGKNALDSARGSGLAIEGFLDKRAENGEYVFEGYNCIVPSKVLEKTERDFFIIIGSRNFAHEIYKVLKSYGLIENKDFWSPISGELIDY
jgi:hypothetical protein